MNIHETLTTEREKEIIDRVLDGKGFDLHAFDIGLVLSELKNHEFRTFVLERVKASIGMDDIEIGHALATHTELLIDEMLMQIIETFEQCYVARITRFLTREEMAWLATSVPAMRAAKLLYETLVIPDSASGRFVRMQRVGTTLYLVYPN
ncbi:hypothetical protein AVT69_gp039 [Pseudomonas phage PhiPA3]|uniref:Uncharacterized protein 038 n=1 Tax=Pseudomonas phage PhiPA3 TaxID=998086 RepID=F8SJS0_BPPA3|nr:hypothetical protein AVT69_gp039 [Pseudomonas phage PhiPA3]AEH03465.1 hypothetical protein [Pseudomonas phage PhiPA3]